MRRNLLILAFLLVLFGLRCWNLAGRTVAHDESLFGYYAYELAQGRGYQYDPMLHGPFLLEAQAVVFRIFGSNKFWLRLVPLICGILLFPALLILRPFAGARCLRWAALLILVSPSILFYSRFLRCDLPILLATLLTIGCAGRALGRREAAFIVPALVSGAWMFCIKENAVFVVFIMLIYSLALLAVDTLRGTAAEPRIDFYSARWLDSSNPAVRRGALSLYWCLGLWAALFCFDQLLLTALLPDFPLAAYPALDRARRGGIGLALLSFLFLASYLPLNIAAGFFSGRRGAEQRWGRTFNFLRHNAPLFGAGLLAAYLLLTLVFTVGLSRPAGLIMLLRQTVSYWWAEHASQRLGGPYHYYLPILWVYEAPALLIVICGGAHDIMRSRVLRRAALPAWLIVCGALLLLDGADGRVDRILNGPLHFMHLTAVEHALLAFSWVWWGGWLTMHWLWQTERPGHDCARAASRISAKFISFCWLWSAGMLLCFTYAGEKVPWLVVHQALPLLILAGLQLGRLFDWLERGLSAAQSTGGGAGATDESVVAVDSVSRGFSKKMRTGAAYALVAALLCWQGFLCVRSCIWRNGDPLEIIVHNHTMPAIEQLAGSIIAREAEVAREYAPGERAVPLHTAVGGEATWPLAWYLRELKGVQLREPDNPQDFIAVVRDPANQIGGESSGVADPLEGENYASKYFVLRAHWEFGYIRWAELQPATNWRQRARQFCRHIPAYLDYYFWRRLPGFTEERLRGEFARTEIELAVRR